MVRRPRCENVKSTFEAILLRVLSLFFRHEKGDYRVLRVLCKRFSRDLLMPEE